MGGAARSAGAAERSRLVLPVDKRAPPIWTEPGSRGCRDVVHPDGVYIGQPGVDQVWIAEQRRVFAECIRSRVDGGQLVQPLALVLSLSPSQFDFRRAIAKERVDLGQQGDLQFLD